MKKFLLTLGVASLALSSFASTRILYQQNFESCNTVEESGWSIAGGTAAIASNEYGKFLELALGQNNGRSAQVTWGQDIFMDNGESILEEGVYNLEFDFKIVTGSTNQYNGCLTVFTNHTPIASQPYRNPWSPAGYWQNYVFDMSQVANESYQFAVNGGTIETTADDNTKSYAIDYSDPTTFEQGKYYKVVLEVNTASREVNYQVIDPANDYDIVKDGVLVVPETDVDGNPINLYAEGIFIMLARYQTTYNIDNIKISTETSYEYANAPTITMTRLGMTEDEQLDVNLRAYTISFIEGETLHVIGTDGEETVVEWDECEGAYVYETTTSGTLKAYTSVGDAKSAEVEATVDCNPVVLPEVTATISSVSAGYGKTYTLSVSNADVPMRPTIFINYEFTGVNGEKLSGEDCASGEKVTVSEEGVLKLTSAAYGYQSKTITINNDLEFETKLVYDFARMTEEEIKAAGLTKVDPLRSDATSGENNWTARKRLYYNDVNSATENEDGETVYTAVYPFGYVAEDENALIERYLCDNTGKESVDSEAYFDGLSIFPDAGKKKDGFPNVGMLYRIGLYNNETTNSNNNVIIKNLDATDFVVVNSINNYGGNSIHPVVATAEEYYKTLAGEDAVYSVATQGTEVKEGEGEAAVGTGVYTLTHALYRIDTAITKITIFKQAGAQSGVTGVEAEVEGDNWYYSIDGVRMAEPTRPGIYIHNGKKIIVK